jgi:hypothetical protein
MGIFKVIKLIFQGKAKEPIIFARISMVQFHHETREMEIRMDDELVHEAWSHALSESGNIVEPIHSQVELIVNEGRLAYPATFGSVGAISSAGNDFFKDDANRSSNEDLSGFDESTGNVGSSTGLSSLYTSRSAPGGGNVGSSITGLSLSISRSAPSVSSNVGSSTGLPLSTLRQQQDEDANSAESC